LYEGGDIITPTQFNLDRMYSLGVEVKSVKEILSDTVGFYERLEMLE
jgi:hypothetical protein